MLGKHTFVKLKQSNFPGIILENNNCNNTYLVSIVEYQGDYIFIDSNNLSEIKLLPEEKLSILGKFGDWFYDQHTDIFQQIILENLQIYLLNQD